MLGSPAGGSQQQDSNPTPKTSASRLAHPTTFHMEQLQQTSSKGEAGHEPPQMMEHQHLYFAQQGQQEVSPSHSDADYPELPTSSSLSGIPATDLHQHKHHHIQQQQPSLGLHPNLSSTQEHTYGYNHPATTTMATAIIVNDTNNSNTKRIPGPMTAVGSAQLRYQQQQDHYYSPNPLMYYQAPSSSADQRYYYRPSAPFAVSAPANIVYNDMLYPTLGENSVSQNDGRPTTIVDSNRIVSGAAEQAVYEQTSGQGVADGSDVIETYEDDYAAQANLQAIMEKRRRRRESHNEVERRRRDNINDRIQDLGQMLPETMTEDEGGIARLNKGAILRKSVEQIKSLQREVRHYQHQIRDLEETLHRLNHNKQTQQTQRQG